MNENFPPLQIPTPQTAERKKEKSRPIPLAPEVIAKRAEIARRLQDQIQPLSESLKRMTDEERRAVFYKLEHEGPVSLTGTGLKAVSEPSERFTLAVPIAEDLSAFTGKLDEFANAPPKKNVVPHSRLATAIETIQLGEPKDRLSQELLENYDTLVRKDFLVCEVELLSLHSYAKQQREELVFRLSAEAELELQLAGALSLKHEEIKGTCRVVIRCTGRLFQKLVEDREWQRRIYWFEARPEFETFHSLVSNFRVDRLGEDSPPPRWRPGRLHRGQRCDGRQSVPAARRQGGSAEILPEIGPRQSGR